MGKEIERKFLVKNDGWRKSGRAKQMRQGYLCVDPERTVRVRRSGDAAFVTIKGISQGASRAEFEYPIPVADAEAMLNDLCLKPLVEKTRYRLEHAGLIWEVDEFSGDNQGLILAEVELEQEDQEIQMPDWLGEEVTGDSRYFNAALVKKPFRDW